MAPPNSIPTNFADVNPPTDVSYVDRQLDAQFRVPVVFGLEIYRLVHSNQTIDHFIGVSFYRKRYTKCGVWT